MTHPRWQQLEIIDYKVDVDFENIYGNDFSFLQNLKPSTTFLSLGSKIIIEVKESLSSIKTNCFHYKF